MLGERIFFGDDAILRSLTIGREGDERCDAALISSVHKSKDTNISLIMGVIKVSKCRYRD